MRIDSEMEGNLEEEDALLLDFLRELNQYLPADLSKDLNNMIDYDLLQTSLDSPELDGDMTRPMYMGEEPAISPAATNMDGDMPRILPPVPDMAHSPSFHMPSHPSNIMFPSRTTNPITLQTAKGASYQGESTHTPVSLLGGRKRAASYSFGEVEPVSHIREAKLVTASSFQTIGGETFASRDNHFFHERMPSVQGVLSSSTVSRNPMLTSAVQEDKQESWKYDKQSDWQSCIKGGSSQRRSSTGNEEEEKKTGNSASSSSKPVGKRKKVMLDDFLLELLKDKKYIAYIQWTSEERGEFKFTKPEMVAKLWGDFKKKKLMNYEKLSRGLRYYYTSAKLERIQHKHYHFRFLKKNSGN